MELIQSKKFKDIKIFKPRVYSDHRGFFMESYNQLIQNEIREDFVQDNHSKSKRGVIRGLHYQWDAPMGKLLRVITGKVLDVVLDIRAESPTYGEWESFELSDINNNILWVPAGFAHGFVSLQDDTHLCYRTTALHNGECSGAIHPTLSGLDIDWMLPTENIILSEKDTQAQTFFDYKRDPKFI